MRGAGAGADSGAGAVPSGNATAENVVLDPLQRRLLGGQRVAHLPLEQLDARVRDGRFDAVREERLVF